jgi:hypothetical protein
VGGGLVNLKKINIDSGKVSIIELYKNNAALYIQDIVADKRQVLNLASIIFATPIDVLNQRFTTYCATRLTNNLLPGTITACNGWIESALFKHVVASGKSTKIFSFGNIDLGQDMNPMNRRAAFLYESISLPKEYVSKDPLAWKDPYVTYTYNAINDSRMMEFRNTVSPEYDLAHFVIGSLGNYLIDTNTKETAKLPYDSSYEILSVRRVSP